ncbi:unnamed protein product [Coccothraustes coccothraustes]
MEAGGNRSGREGFGTPGPGSGEETPGEEEEDEEQRWSCLATHPAVANRCFSRRLLLLCLVPLEWPLLDLGPGFGWKDLEVGSSQL